MKSNFSVYILTGLIIGCLGLLSCEKEDSDPSSSNSANNACQYVESADTGLCNPGFLPIFPGLCCPENAPFSTEECDGCYSSCEAAAANCNGTVVRANISAGSINEGLIYQSCGPNNPYDVVIDTDQPLYEGILCLSNVIDGENGLNVGIIEFRYSFNTFFGEPLERAYIRWSNDNGNSEFNTIKLRAEVYTAADVPTGWYFYKSPLVPDSPNEWSFDVSGSPDWDEVFSSIGETSYASASYTQGLFNNGFYLGSFVPVEINGVEYE